MSNREFGNPVTPTSEGTSFTGSFTADPDSEPSHQPDRELEPFTREEKKQLACFWFAGLLNNSSYVIMIAGAKSIIGGGVAIVFLAGIVPSLIVSLSAPYWFHKVPYGVRLWIATILMGLSYTTVALAPNVPIAVAGVAFASAQSGLGEPSFLALASHYERKKSFLTAWSSGTGFAGLFGYGWITVFHKFGGLGFTLTILLANLLAVAWAVLTDRILTRPEGVGWYRLLDEPDDLLLPAEEVKEQGSEVKEQGSEGPASEDMTNLERLLFIRDELWPYTVPLVIVYVSEYAMQSGVWAAIGFPVTDKDARDSFYLYANFCYQAGVFASRSSGMLFQARRGALWAMPVLQAGLCIFFYTDAQYQYWYNWGLYFPAFVTGLLGGAVYVNALTLICQEVDPRYQEFSLTAVATAFSMGIVFANGAGLVMQCELYKTHGIGGATLDC